MIAPEPAPTQPDEVTASRDALLIGALVAGKSQTEAARIAGCERHTVARRLRDQEFVGRLNDARAITHLQTLGVLSNASVLAANKLAALVNSDSEKIALQASRMILDSVTKLCELVELELRLGNIEAELAVDSKSNNQRVNW